MDSPAPNIIHVNPRKHSEKRKQWRGRYQAYLTLENIKSYIEQVGIVKKNIERGPLYQHLEGVLIDEENKELFLYLKAQKDKVWFDPYIYIIPSSIQKWDSGRKNFELCKQDYPNLKAFTFEDLKAKDTREKLKEQKKRRFSEDNEETEEKILLSPNLLSPNLHGEAQEEEEDLWVSDSDINASETPPHVEEFGFGSEGISRLKRKQLKKALQKEGIALRIIKSRSQSFPIFYKELGSGRTFDDLILEYSKKNDGNMLQLLHENEMRFRDFEELIKNASGGEKKPESEHSTQQKDSLYPAHYRMSVEHKRYFWERYYDREAFYNREDRLIQEYLFH